jgi:2-polyprenyl-3-methyl-5-hydroxy-6-metoxy-1,4-benzoquinol methylase
MQKSRCLIVVVAYQAEAGIDRVIQRIPAKLADDYDVGILIIHNSSADLTFEENTELVNRSSLPFRIHTLRNPTTRRYGGSQKLGYQFAIREGYDAAALLDGDGRCAPECLPELLKPITEGRAAAVFGLPMSIEKGGVPFCKHAGKQILTWLQNRILHSNLTDFHSGFRAYSVRALEVIPFQCNSDDFRFDTEIIIQFMLAQLTITELPIPTYYGNEISRANALRYGFNILRTTLQARLQKLSLFYDRKYDCAAGAPPQYRPKFGFSSTHSFAVSAVKANSKVIDLGCGTGYVGSTMKEVKGCYVTGVDAYPLSHQGLSEFYIRDLNHGLKGIPVEAHDYILLLDVIEHLASPEQFLDELRSRLATNPKTELIISTGNVAFVVTRLMLLLGNFNYGKRGILDLTHTRLFTFSSMLRALDEAGFLVLETAAIPAPFPLALGDNTLSRFLLGVNVVLARLSRGLFGYQMILRAKARPTLESLLAGAEQGSGSRNMAIAAVSDRG